MPTPSNQARFPLTPARGEPCRAISRPFQQASYPSTLPTAGSRSTRTESTRAYSRATSMPFTRYSLIVVRRRSLTPAAARGLGIARCGRVDTGARGVEWTRAMARSRSLVAHRQARTQAGRSAISTHLRNLSAVTNWCCVRRCSSIFRRRNRPLRQGPQPGPKPWLRVHGQRVVAGFDAGQLR